MLLGRGSGRINTGGEKVYPEEVEEPLQGAPGRRRRASSSACPTSDGASGSSPSSRPRPGSDRRPGRRCRSTCRAQSPGTRCPRGLVGVDADRALAAGQGRLPAGPKAYAADRTSRRRSLRCERAHAGMDASFLYMETPTSHMHVVGVHRAATRRRARGLRVRASVRQLLADRIHLMPPFRRRLVEVPFDIDHPVWIEDPDFDLDAPRPPRRACPRPATCASWPSSSATSPAARWTAAARCGRCGWSRAWRTATSRSSPRCTTPRSTASPAPTSWSTSSTSTPEVRRRRAADRAVDRRGRRRRRRSCSARRWCASGRARRRGSSAQPVAQRRRTSSARRATLAGDDEERPRCRSPAPRTPFNGALTPHRAVAFGAGRAGRPEGDQEGLRLQDQRRRARRLTLRAARLADRPRRRAGQAARRQRARVGRTRGGRRAGTQPGLGDVVPLPVHLDDPVDAAREVAEVTRSAKEIARRDGRRDAPGLGAGHDPAAVHTGDAPTTAGSSSPTGTGRSRTSSSPTSPARRSRSTPPAPR